MLNNEQHIMEKLLDINSNQSKVNGINITDNDRVNENYSLFENGSKNKRNLSKKMLKSKVKVESQT